MSLARDVAARLEAEDVDFALIGAVAMAVHGVSRSTADIDFLSVDEGLLKRELWTDFEERGATIRLLKGDFEDPLAGSVRLLLERDEIVDVVVGRYRWQEEIIQAADVTSIGEFAVRVVRPSGLVLLKLFAGGPQDMWDIHALLAGHEQADAIKVEVNGKVAQLPEDCRELWHGVRDES